ncbi:MAG: hypothetical protein K940chlam9_01826, partial [Chlamydiae bacterium]|nr:hypothetical protein [Chlamydiota bacterium]
PTDYESAALTAELLPPEVTKYPLVRVKLKGILNSQ